MAPPRKFTVATKRLVTFVRGRGAHHAGCRFAVFEGRSGSPKRRGVGGIDHHGQRGDDR